MSVIKTFQKATKVLNELSTAAVGARSEVQKLLDVLEGPRPVVTPIGIDNSNSLGIQKVGSTSVLGLSLESIHEVNVLTLRQIVDNWNRINVDKGTLSIMEQLLDLLDASPVKDEYNKLSEIIRPTTTQEQYTSIMDYCDINGIIVTIRKMLGIETVTNVFSGTTQVSNRIEKEFTNGFPPEHSWVTEFDKDFTPVASGVDGDTVTEGIPDPYADPDAVYVYEQPAPYKTEIVEL